MDFSKLLAKKYTSSLWRFISWDLRITLILNYIAEFVKEAGRDLFFLSGFLKSRVMHFSLVRFSDLLMKIWYILLLFCWKNFLKEQNIIRYTSILFLQWKTTSASICNGFAIVCHLSPQSWWDVLFLAGEKKSKLCFMEGRGFAELSAVFTFFSSGFIIQRRRRRRESFLLFLILVE